MIGRLTSVVAMRPNHTPSLEAQDQDAVVESRAHIVMANAQGSSISSLRAGYTFYLHASHQSL